MDDPPETLPRPFVRWYLDGEWLGDTPYDEENDSAETPTVKGGLIGHELSWKVVEPAAIQP